jgi:hypothetical protein
VPEVPADRQALVGTLAVSDFCSKAAAAAVVAKAEAATLAMRAVAALAVVVLQEQPMAAEVVVAVPAAGPSPTAAVAVVLVMTTQRPVAVAALRGKVAKVRRVCQTVAASEATAAMVLAAPKGESPIRHL